jgi:His/Glu/Gln/Arg/opine family amino acid ABC transporter permease subunit
VLGNWWSYFQTELATGLVVTLKVLVISSVTTASWGAVIVALRLSGIAPLRWFAVAYVEFFRGTPLIVQVLVIFAFLPSIGIRFPAMETAVIALTLNAGGYMAEFYRAGIQAVPKGQIEAAAALGMNRWTTVHRLIAPVAIRVILPAVGNITISILLTTPFVYLVGLQELMARAGLIQIRTSDFTVYLEIVLIYVVLGLLLTAANSWLERRLRLP